MRIFADRFHSAHAQENGLAISDLCPTAGPRVRNDYAHGSTELHNWALRSFQIVSEIINQLYPKPA